jgi:polar amino acid transport system substrate-binding protein
MVGAVNKLAALAMSTLTVAVLVSPGAAANTDPCTPHGLDDAVAPKILPAPTDLVYEDTYTTPTVEPLDAVDVDALGLNPPGVLKVASQIDGQPNACREVGNSKTAGPEGPVHGGQSQRLGQHGG